MEASEGRDQLTAREASGEGSKREASRNWRGKQAGIGEGSKQEVAREASGREAMEASGGEAREASERAGEQVSKGVSLALETSAFHRVCARSGQGALAFASDRRGQTSVVVADGERVPITDSLHPRDLRTAAGIHPVCLGRVPTLQICLGWVPGFPRTVSVAWLSHSIPVDSVGPGCCIRENCRSRAIPGPSAASSSHQNIPGRMIGHRNCLPPVLRPPRYPPGVPPLIFCPYVVSSLHKCYFIGLSGMAERKNLRNKNRKKYHLLPVVSRYRSR